MNASFKLVQQYETYTSTQYCCKYVYTTNIFISVDGTIGTTSFHVYMFMFQQHTGRHIHDVCACPPSGGCGGGGFTIIVINYYWQPSPFVSDLEHMHAAPLKKGGGNYRIISQ